MKKTITRLEILLAFQDKTIPERIQYIKNNWNNFSNKQKGKFNKYYDLKNNKVKKSNDKKLFKDILPKDIIESKKFNESKAKKYIYYEVIEEIDNTIESNKYINSNNPFIPANKYNIKKWWLLDQDIAIGWNILKSGKWSFPVKKVK